MVVPAITVKFAQKKYDMAISIKEHEGYRYVETEVGLMQGVINLNDPTEVISPFCKYCIDNINNLPDNSRVLILGGGTFTIPKAIKKSVNLSIVEYDPYMVRAAKEQFEYVQPDNHVIHVADADMVISALSPVGKEFVSYGIIIVDLFDGREVPKFAREKSFYDKLARLTDRVIVNEISTTGDPKFNYSKEWKCKSVDLMPDENLYWKLTVLMKSTTHS